MPQSYTLGGYCRNVVVDTCGCRTVRIEVRSRSVISVVLAVAVAARARRASVRAGSMGGLLAVLTGHVG